MKPMYLSIQPEKTGKRIKRLLFEQGYTIKEIQGAFGFEIHRLFTNGSLENLYRAWTISLFLADCCIPRLKISSSLTGIFLVLGEF